MGSKLNLTWANFQANINKSLDLFKSQHSFCDVTLVSDDQQLISAHRVVLAASSEFFKDILKSYKAHNVAVLIYNKSNAFFLCLKLIHQRVQGR